MKIVASHVPSRVPLMTGRHYEQHLEHVVRSLGLSYETEEHMREKGLPRTPDIRLLVPIGVRSHDDSGKVRSGLSGSENTVRLV